MCLAEKDGRSLYFEDNDFVGIVGFYYVSQETMPNPTDRGKLGSKRHIVVDARGIPLAVTVTGANRHDSMGFESTLNAIPAVPGLDDRPRKRPGKLRADKGYDYARRRHYLRRRGITARIARKGIESRDRLGRYRWIVERTHALGLQGSGSCTSVSSAGWTFTVRSFRWPLPLSFRAL